MTFLDPRYAALSYDELDAAIKAIPDEVKAWHASEMGQLAGCPGACRDCARTGTCYLAIKAHDLWSEKFTRNLVSAVVGVVLR